MVKGRHCRRRAIYWLLRSPSQTCHAKPKTQINRRRTLPASFPLRMPTASSLAWKDFSPEKVRTLWHCSRLWAWRFTYDWSWWYPSGNRPLQQYLGFTAGRWLYRLTQGWQPDCKIQIAGGTGQRDFDVRAESPRLSPLWLSASSSACHGLLIITGATPLPTKPSVTKMPEKPGAGERGNYWHADASAWCCCARCKIHEGVSWC